MPFQSHSPLNLFQQSRAEGKKFFQIRSDARWEKQLRELLTIWHALKERKKEEIKKKAKFRGTGEGPSMTQTVRRYDL